MVLATFAEQSLASSRRSGDSLVRVVPSNLVTPILSQPRPQWINPTVARLESLAQLPEDWDSYGASPVRTSRIQQAYGLLQSIMDDETPAPDLVPTANGSIQIEWHTLGVELEIHLLSDADLDVYFVDLEGTEGPLEGVLSYDVTRLRTLMQVLASRSRQFNVPHAVDNG